MIASWQARNLIILVCIAIAGVIFEVVAIGLAITTIYIMFAFNALFYKKERILNKCKLIWWWVWRFLFGFIYIVLSQFLVWYFWLVWAKNYCNKIQNWSFILNISFKQLVPSSKIKKIVWPFLIFSMFAIPGSAYAIYYFTSYKKCNSKVGLWNIEPYLTL